GRHHRDRRYDLHGLAGRKPSALLPPRVVREVHAVPRGHRLAPQDSPADRTRRGSDARPRSPVEHFGQHRRQDALRVRRRRGDAGVDDAQALPPRVRSAHPRRTLHAAGIMAGLARRRSGTLTPLLIAQIVLTLVVFVALLSSAAAMVYFERKVAAHLQQRVGPSLVGSLGLLQPLADVIKLMFKEELRPKASDAILFSLAPVIPATAAFAAFAVVPFGGETTIFGLLDEPLGLHVADVNVAILIVFAIASMGVYGIVLAGWSSNSKYSLLGGLRSSAQMISYELSYGLSLAGVLLIAYSLSLVEIVNQQADAWLGFIPRWFVFLQPVGFLIFMTAGVAETNRAPFDFPEAEQELVAGYHTEYSSMRFALFF